MLRVDGSRNDLADVLSFVVVHSSAKAALLHIKSCPKRFPAGHDGGEGKSGVVVSIPDRHNEVRIDIAREREADGERDGARGRECYSTAEWVGPGYSGDEAHTYRQLEDPCQVRADIGSRIFGYCEMDERVRDCGRKG